LETRLAVEWQCKSTRLVVLILVVFIKNQIRLHRQAFGDR
jgi:hypothetical protein